MVISNQICSTKKASIMAGFVNRFPVSPFFVGNLIQSRYNYQTLNPFLTLPAPDLFIPFHATGLFLHPLNTSENQFSDAFKEYRKWPVAWNRLSSIPLPQKLHEFSLRGLQFAWWIFRSPKLIIWVINFTTSAKP